MAYTVFRWPRIMLFVCETVTNFLFRTERYPGTKIVMCEKEKLLQSGLAIVQTKPKIVRD